MLYQPNTKTKVYRSFFVLLETPMTGNDQIYRGVYHVAVERFDRPVEELFGSAIGIVLERTPIEHPDALSVRLFDETGTELYTYGINTTYGLYASVCRCFEGSHPLHWWNGNIHLNPDSLFAAL